MKANGHIANEDAEIVQIRHQLDQITQSARAGLVDYARRRLWRVGLDPALAEDITQDAFKAILVGLETKTEGRHPRPVDVKTWDLFLDYMGGIINSLVAYERGKRRYRFEHEMLDVSNVEEDEAPFRLEIRSRADVQSEAGWNDLQAAFFARLKPRGFQQIQPILADWEAEWKWSSVIPMPIPQRRFRKDVRQLAKDVMRELGETLTA